MRRNRQRVPTYTGRDGASRADVDALCRAVLAAQRERLTRLEVDVCSDEPWPDDVEWAVDELTALTDQQRGRFARRFGWGPSITARLDPRDDRHVELAAAVASRTIGSCGLGEDGRPIWSVDDTGTSLWFALRPAELDAVRAGLVARGVSEDVVVPFETGRERRERGARHA